MSVQSTQSGERSGVSPLVSRFCTGKLTHAARQFSQLMTALSITTHRKSSHLASESSSKRPVHFPGERHHLNSNEGFRQFTPELGNLNNGD